MILAHLDQNLWAFLEIFRDLRKIFGLKDLAENSHILSQIWLNCRKFWTFEAVFHKRKNNCTPAKYSVGPLHGCQVFFCDFLKIILYVDLVISRAQSQKNGKKSKMTEISVKLWALESRTSWKSGISGKLTPMILIQMLYKKCTPAGFCTWKEMSFLRNNAGSGHLLFI